MTLAEQARADAAAERRAAYRQAYVRYSASRTPDAWQSLHAILEEARAILRAERDEVAARHGGEP